MIRVDLAQEAIRLARTLYAARPDDSEVALLIHARHRARTAPDGSLIPMAEQDRSLWDRGAIDEGIALVTAALPRGPIGPYQLQAAIAAVHDEAENPEATDWRQIAALYGVLLRLDDNPIVALNHAVAVSMVAGPPGRPRTSPASWGRCPDQRRSSLPRRPLTPPRDGWRPCYRA